MKVVLVEQIEKIASILNLKDGIFHLQYIYDGERPMIIEVMRRILGNMYHVPGNLVTGMDWEYWETRARCGLSLEGMPVNQEQEGCFAYKAIVSERNGVFNHVNVPQEYDKYIIGKYWLRDSGYVIENYKSDPLGFLFFMFPSEKEMLDCLIEHYPHNLVDVK